MKCSGEDEIELNRLGGIDAFLMQVCIAARFFDSFLGGKGISH